MWLSVMAVFVVYGSTFILFEDYDRKWIKPFSETSDWHPSNIPVRLSAPETLKLERSSDVSEIQP